MSKPMNNRRMVESKRLRARPRGVSLIELMIALVISLALIAGAIQVYVFSRKQYEDNEGLARLQETARYALSVIEPDIRMANSWGLASGFLLVGDTGFRADCGENFAGAPDSAGTATLDGANNQYSLTCPAFGAGAVASADTLVVRRASVLPTAKTNPHLVVCSTRTQAKLIKYGTAACTAAPIGQMNDLVVNAYYISRDAEQRAGLPTLRRWSLTGNDTEEMAQVEIVPGVEDLQVQFGIDPSGALGAATRYVNPEEVPPNAQVVSVRLWLLVRSETPEQGFRDDKVYEYGDRSEATGKTGNLNGAGAATLAYEPKDNFRRLLVSRTIQIRNSMGI